MKVHTMSFMATKLTTAKRIQILSMLVEGSSMRSISRVVDVSMSLIDTRAEPAKKRGAYKARAAKVA